jgi:hypothetical protein
MLICSFFFILSPTLKSENSYYKFYETINNTEALSYIDSLSLFPQKFSSGIGCGYKNDPDDKEWNIIAEDFGSGVITHIWTQYYQVPDSSFFFKLTIDGKLILEMPMEEFFGANHGYLRYPFYNRYSGCYVSDIQIPYHSSYKISVKRNDPAICALFWSVQWKQLPNNIVPLYSIVEPDTSYINALISAEDAFKLGQPQIKYQDVFYYEAYLAPGDTATIANITKSGIIKGFYISLNKNTLADINELQLLCYWDGSPYPSVNVPLVDFFGLGEGDNNFNSFFIKSNTNENWSSTFPMPFRESGVIKLINHSRNHVPIHSFTYFEHKNIEIDKYAYFHSQESKSYPTKISIYHPVAHIKGKGRYVGTFLYIHDNNNGPSFMEGNPMFLPDSNKEYFINYIGTEDFFNGGWYFKDGSYMSPFSGCPSTWSMMYRYHALDGIDFNKSLDVDFQHGVNNDFNCNYRTVAFYYKQWTPFWIDQDTIRTGATIKISGSGFEPNDNIYCKIDSIDLFNTLANDIGKFSITTKIPNYLKNGFHYLTINGIQKPEQLYVFDEPMLEIIKDSSNHQYKWKDSLYIIGHGFKPNTSINLMMNDLELVEKPITDNYGSFSTFFQIPRIHEGLYYIFANDSTSLIKSDSSIDITRRLNYEFEDLAVQKTEGIYYNWYCGFFKGNWSREFSLFFSPWKLGRSITFLIDLPVSDTFNVNLFFGKYRNSGIYSVFIDGKYCIDINGYQDVDKGYPIRSDSCQILTSYIEKGEHTIQFFCNSKESNSMGIDLLVDNIEFIPTTKFKEINDSTNNNQPIYNHFSIYQNPIHPSNNFLNIILPNILTESTYYLVSLYDYLGNHITDLFSGYYIKGTIQTDLPMLSESLYLCVLRIYRKDKIVIQSLPLIVNY